MGKRHFNAEWIKLTQAINLCMFWCVKKDELIATCKLYTDINVAHIEFGALMQHSEKRCI